MKRKALILTGIGISLALAGCTSQSLEGQQEQVNFLGMDTYMTITAYGEDAGEAVEEAQARILELEKEWSVTDEGSQIYQANHSGGTPVTLTDDTKDVVSFALEMAEETGGALEPTIYPVLEAWGFTTDENRIPASDEIQALLEHVGYEQVSLNGNELTLPEGVELDLGAHTYECVNAEGEYVENASVYEFSIGTSQPDARSRQLGAAEPVTVICRIGE